jgi:hypothetical protein
MKLYDADQEEKQIEIAIQNQNENFLESESDFDLDMLFGGESDITESLVEENPVEGGISIYDNDSAYYRELIEQLKSDKLIAASEAEFVDNSYLEITNTKELNRVLFGLPKEARPATNDVYRLSLDGKTVQNAIEEARYMMTQLEASVDKDVALVARYAKLPANTAWYVIHGQVANNLGQAVISEFFVIAVHQDGGLAEKPVRLQDFVTRFGINEPLQTQSVSDFETKALEDLLPNVIDWATELYMFQIQQRKSLEMERDQKVYEEKLKNWERNAKDQLEINFSDKTMTGFVKRRYQDQERDIETIISSSSQYYRDMASLNQDAYLKVISVFFN